MNALIDHRLSSWARIFYDVLYMFPAITDGVGCVFELSFVKIGEVLGCKDMTAKKAYEGLLQWDYLKEIRRSTGRNAAVAFFIPRKNSTLHKINYESSPKEMVPLSPLWNPNIYYIQNPPIPYNLLVQPTAATLKKFSLCKNNYLNEKLTYIFQEEISLGQRKSNASHLGVNNSKNRSVSIV